MPSMRSEIIKIKLCKLKNKVRVGRGGKVPVIHSEIICFHSMNCHMQCPNLIKFQFKISVLPFIINFWKRACTQSQPILNQAFVVASSTIFTKFVSGFRYFQVTKWEVYLCVRKAVNLKLYFF